MTDAIRQALATRVGELERALRAAARNDATIYAHHQPRMFDRRRPEEDDSAELAGGTIWLTPREIARRVLREPELATVDEALRTVKRL